ncbi:GNAT family N-acetyltransferase [Sungkyunkwania multivorans]|uniref:GNAT family N-acetyltransferase n=1 Tax=Sungkyunkwania multivorans TaxID=1173618 RepID=A0ABW3CUZ7_9FLAO
MIRNYTKNDKEKVVELLRANTPAFFDPSEEEDYINYLETEVEDYFVYEENSNILGAGGINYFPEERTARISWDVVAPNVQGKGIGKQLVEHRIAQIRKNKGIDSIVVRTSQLTYKFYEKFGFELEKVEKDFWAKDLDLYLMSMKTSKAL